MRSVAIIGYTGKGSFNTPTKIDNVNELHNTFGIKSNLTAVAEQLVYADFSPTIVRVEEEVSTASATVLDDNGMPCMTINADSPGSAGKMTVVEIIRNDNSFNISVSNSGEIVEFWGNLRLDQVDEVVNFASKWINISIIRNSLPKTETVELKTEKETKQYIELDKILTAIKSVDHLDVEFISLPDCDSQEIINSVLQYLEEYKPDTILVIDPPSRYDLLETYKWCKGLIPSEQGVVFWPWLNYEKKSIPPSGSILIALLSWPFVWKPIRTRLLGVSDTVFNIHRDELVYLSKQEHFINTINKSRDSLLIDTKILTLAGSKLSERRLLNYIKHKISKLGIDLLSAHNPVSANFRCNFIESSGYILQPIKDDQGINNYIIQVNEFCKPEEFEVSLELAIRDSFEIVNICFKFSK